MNEVVNDIKDQLGQFSSKYGPKVLRTATVTAINNNDTVAIQLPNGREVDDARLRAVVASGNKVVLVPKINSTVIVGMLENSDEFVVLGVSEVTGLKCVIDTVTVEVDNTGVLIQRGTDSLKKVLQDLITAINALTVPTAVGPSGTPINATSFTSISTRINQFIK